MAKLTDKQRRFVQEYLVDRNATQAAIRAGYSKKTAKQMGTENLAKPAIAEAITKGQKRVSEKLDVTIENVVAELAKLAFANMDDYVEVMADGSAAVDLRNLNRDQMAAIGEVSREASASSKRPCARGWLNKTARSTSATLGGP